MAHRQLLALCIGLTLILGSALCLYLAWRPSPFLSELSWLPESFARWADHHAQSNSRTAIPFFILGLVGALVGPATASKGLAWMAFAALIGLSVLLELGQLWAPGRHPTVADVLWGWTGLSAGWGSMLGARFLLRRKAN